MPPGSGKWLSDRCDQKAEEHSKPRMAKASADLSHWSSPTTPGLRAQRASIGASLGLSFAPVKLCGFLGSSCPTWPSLHGPRAPLDRDLTPTDGSYSVVHSSD